MHSVGDLVSLLHTFYTEHSEQKAYSGQWGSISSCWSHICFKTCNCVSFTSTCLFINCAISLLQNVHNTFITRNSTWSISVQCFVFKFVFHTCYTQTFETQDNPNVYFKLVLFELVIIIDTNNLETQYDRRRILRRSYLFKHITVKCWKWFIKK